MPWILPLTHPAAIVRGQWAREPLQEAALRRLYGWVKAGEDPPDQPALRHEPPPGAILFPSIGQLESMTYEGWDGVSLDLETAGDHIICCGVTPLMWDGTLGTALCWRVLKRGGRQWWHRDELARAARWFAGVLEDPRLAKVFWNGVTFDVPVLERNGFEVRGRLVDGMVMMHTVYAEMPKGLQSTATLFLGAPAWKGMVREDPKEDG